MRDQLKLDTVAAISSVRRRAHIALCAGNNVEYAKLMGDLYALESILSLEEDFSFPGDLTSNVFSDNVYEAMLENDEMWIVSPSGNACNVSDAALLDC